jgi:hypothetical protein
VASQRIRSYSVGQYNLDCFENCSFLKISCKNNQIFVKYIIKTLKNHGEASFLFGFKHLKLQSLFFFAKNKVKNLKPS